MEWILGRELKKHEIVDHINGNTLDNTDGNLRPATKIQNSQNGKAGRNKSSKYKGVKYVKSGNRTKRWLTRITVNKKVKYIGYSLTEEEAALKYNEAALKYFGEFARLNVID